MKGLKRYMLRTACIVTGMAFGWALEWLLPYGQDAFLIGWFGAGGYFLSQEIP